MHLPVTALGVYPDAELDGQRAAAAGFTPEVTARLLNYVAALNLADAARQVESFEGIAKRHEEAGQHALAEVARAVPLPRHKFYRLADPARGARYLRVVDVNAQDPDRRISAVEAFVEIGTGLVYKPDGYKRPAKGPRYSLATDEKAADLIRVAGQPYYLYR